MEGDKLGAMFGEIVGLMEGAIKRTVHSRSWLKHHKQCITKPTKTIHSNKSLCVIFLVFFVLFNGF